MLIRLLLILTTLALVTAAWSASAAARTVPTHCDTTPAGFGPSRGLAEDSTDIDSIDHRPHFGGRYQRSYPGVQCIVEGSPYEDSLVVTDFDMTDSLMTERVVLRVIEPAGFTINPWAVTSGPAHEEFAWVKITCPGVPGPVGKLRIRLLAQDTQGNEDTLLYYINVSARPIFSMSLAIWNTDIQYGNNAFQNLIFGIGGTATTGMDANSLGMLDSQYCEYELPPPPPAHAFDARWVVPGRLGTLRNIYPDNPRGATRAMVWLAHFNAGDDIDASYPVVVAWSMSEALKSPHTLYLEDRLWNDSTGTGLFRINMKNGRNAVGTLIGVAWRGDSIFVTINLPEIDGFKIVYDLTLDVDEEKASPGLDALPLWLGEAPGAAPDGASGAMPGASRAHPASTALATPLSHTEGF